VLLSVCDGAHTTQVTASSDHAQVATVELDVVSDFAGTDVDLDGVVDLDEGVWVADGAGIMGAQVWDTLGPNPHLADFAELVLGFFLSDAVDNEAPLDVVDQAEVLTSLVDGDDIHESRRVGDVSADLAVNLDVALHHDLLGLHVCEGILQAVAEEDDERETFSQLVWSCRCTGSKGSIQLPKHPMLGSV